MPTNELVLIGERIRKIRKAKGWPQTVLASHAGVDQKTISNIERGGGQQGSITISNIAKVAAALKIPLWLILLPEADDLINDASLPGVIHNYARALPEGRNAIARVSEMEARYTNNA